MDILGIQNVSQRIHFFTPDISDVLSKINVSTASLLYYSPKTINRLISFIGETPAYIVGGYPSFDEVKLGMRLGLPSLSGNPFINKKYLDLVECKTMLKRKKIDVGEYSPTISDQTQMVDIFSSMVINYPHFDQWEFNIVDEIDGRGKAQFKIDSINLMAEIRKCEKVDDRYRYLDQLKDQIKRFISSNINIAAPKLFRNYAEYKKSFMECGGVIESLGLGDNYVIGAQYLIHPDGYIEYITSYEELMTSFGLVVGYICPQVHLPEKTITSLGHKVCTKI